jgi:diguanylate cyclase (GGDEF)-like protein
VSLILAARQHRSLRAAVVEPADRLLTAMEGIGRGELDHAVEVEGPLELRRIGEGLNDMAGALARERRGGEARQHQLERKNTFVELLAAIAAAANEAPTVEDAFRLAVERVGAYTGWSVGHAYHREPGSPFRSMDVWYLEDPGRFAAFKEATEEESFDITEGLGRAVLQTGRAQWVSHFPTISRFSRNDVAGDAGLETALVFPVVLHREVLGLLEFFSTEDQEPDEELLAVMDSVGVQLSQVLERAESQSQLREANERLNAWVGELENRNHEASSLNEMSDLLQSCETSEEAYTVIADAGARLFAGAAGCLYERNASRNLVVPVATWGVTKLNLDAFPPDDCWALRRGRSHVVQHDRAGLTCKHVEGTTDEDLMCLPLAAQGEVLGMIHLRFPPSLGRETLERLRDVAVGFAERVALATANFKLRETLRNQSIRDPLTDLFNRRYAQETLEREIHRARRAETPLSVIMADIDHFKAFNDRFGHDVGDKVLTTVADTLKRSVRSEDVACRYGGEEFMLVMLEALAEDARVRAEGIRRAIEGLDLMHEGRSLGSITLSLGVAAFPEHGPSWEAVVTSADEALYEAKHGGRNRVVVHGLEVDPVAVAMPG